MSQSADPGPRIQNGDVEPPEDDPLKPIRENRELYERVAEADLPISARIRRALEHLDADESGGEV